MSVHFHDMTQYDLSPDPHDNTIPAKSTSSLPFDSTAASFDLVILDGHCLHSRAFNKQMPSMLLVTQLIIALQSVADGGTLFVKLSKPTRDATARVLWLLDTVSSKLETIKPRTIHGHRGTFYAVAKGIRKDRNLAIFLGKLRQFQQIMIDNPEKDVNNGWDQVIPLWILKETYIPRLIELATPVWEVQIEFLRRFLRRKGLL